MISRQELMKMVEGIPPFPESVHKVLAMTASADCSPKELVKVIEYDPILTAEVLRLVNSAYFGLSREVTSINHAVVYVGVNTVKNVAIALATKGALPVKNKAGLEMHQFWAHSLSVGVIAKKIMASRGKATKDDANFFVAGLLHDIGKILFAHFIPENYRQVIEKLTAENLSMEEILVVEKTVLGFDHSEAGAMLGEKWKLPDELVSCIGYHHDVTKAKKASDILYATATANYVSHYLETNKENPEEALCLPAELQEWLEISEEALLNGMGSVEEDLEKAKSFIELT